MIAEQSAELDGTAGRTAPEDSDLLAGLAARGMCHLRSVGTEQPTQPMTDAALIAGLATNAEPRLREALILLFLRQSRLSASVPGIAVAYEAA